MALVINDRVKETTTTTGTGTVTLGGAVSGFETFSAGIGNSNTTYYCIVLNAEFEVGLGTLSSDSSTLARTTVISSSNSDSAVNFSAGTKFVFCTMPASKSLVLDASNNITLPAKLIMPDVTSGKILVGDGTSYEEVAVSGDVTIASSGAITIANNAVETAMINADAVTGAKIADDAINSEHYTDGSIDTAHIADSQITNAKMADNAIDTAEIAASAVETAKINDAAVTTAKITDGNVTTAKIAADAITGAKIADNAINSEHYTDGSIDTAHIANDQITNALMADDAIGADQLAANAVVTASIVDDNVTQAKIADDAVGADQLAANAVVTASIVDDNVTQAKIADDAVGADQLAANAVVNASVASGAAIADTKLATISTANKVDIGALDIDGASDIGAALADADLIIVDDGAGGTEKKCEVSRIKTYIADVTLTTAAQPNITSVGTLTGITTTGNLAIGTEDNNASIIEVNGAGAGSDEGGEIRLDMAADHDGTYNHYRVDVFQDDLRIGRAGTTDITLDASGDVTLSGTLAARELEASNGITTNNETISASYTFPTGYNGMSVGPITVASGVTVTVPSGQRWVIL